MIEMEKSLMGKNQSKQKKGNQPKNKIIRSLINEFL